MCLGSHTPATAISIHYTVYSLYVHLYSMYCRLGCRDFDKWKATYSMMCQIVVGPQFQNFMS